MVLYVRELTGAEKEQLRTWSTCNDPVMRHRAKVVLLSSRGYRVPEMGPLLKSHPANLRKWIHRFNERGCEGLRTIHSGGPKKRFSGAQRARIVRLAQTKPRDLGLHFTHWTLHRLARHAAKQRIVDRISHECVRQILKEANCDYRGGGNKERE